MASSPVEEMTLYDLDRSNKGASKQRRDQINSEISVIRDLLPLPESARQRLSQLQVMSLSCVYIRKCNVLTKLFQSSKLFGKDCLNTDFCQALTGFLLITTREGKLIYISENVADYLGHSMVDMKTQGDSLYDIVDKRDHSTVQTQLLQTDATNPDVSFFCRMNMSRSLKRQAGFGDVKVMYVKGHFVRYPGQEATGSDSPSVFMGTCTPFITPDLKENLVQNNTMVYKTVHQLDLTFLEVSQTAEHHLGSSTSELYGKSWYGMLHPEDLQEARDKHVQLIRSSHEIGCMLIVRMIKADNSIFWVNVVMYIKQATISTNDEPVIMCINQVISEKEAYQFKLQSQMFQFYPTRTVDPWQQTSSCPTMIHEQESRWLQPSSGFTNTPRLRNINSPSVYGSGSTCPTASYAPYIDGRGRRNVTEQKSTTGVSCQTERLKEMLKRKLTSSCRPSKVARLTANGNDDNTSGTSFDFSSSTYMVSNIGNFNDSFSATSQGGWIGSTQVMPQSNYRIPGVALEHKKNMLVEHDSRSPTARLQEQVVPDSYLTPEPSPVSSPDPQRTGFTTMDILDEPQSIKISSKCIIEELTQLANMSGRTRIKDEYVPPPSTNRRKELPVIDPCDIVSFFEDFDVTKKDFEIPKPQTLLQDTHKQADDVCVKQKRQLPLFDAIELEEFFNDFNDVNQNSQECMMDSLVDYQPMTFEQHMFAQEESLPVVKVEPSTSQGMSPMSMSELSEDDDMLDDLTSVPIEMSVCVKEEKYANTSKENLTFEEDELYHLQKLLTSFAQANGTL